MNVPHHPMWDSLNLLIFMGGATLMLYVTATSFDSTELHALGGMGAVGGAAIGAKWVWSKFLQG
jgi:hypothetical protein